MCLAITAPNKLLQKNFSVVLLWLWNIKVLINPFIDRVKIMFSFLIFDKKNHFHFIQIFDKSVLSAFLQFFFFVKQAFLTSHSLYIIYRLFSSVLSQKETQSFTSYLYFFIYNCFSLPFCERNNNVKLHLYSYIEKPYNLIII